MVLKIGKRYEKYGEKNKLNSERYGKYGRKIS
jgi:hypothetical protein